MTKAEQEAVKEKSKTRRYKKPILKELNLETIRNTLYDITEAASEIEWMERMGDDGKGVISQMLGDDEEAEELQNFFGSVSADAYQMLEDLENSYLIPDVFDTWFAGIADGGFEYLGFDAYEGDYYPLESSIERSWARSAANERLMRMTKKELLEASAACFTIAMNYMSIKSRYEDLRESLDILRGKNGGTLKAVMEIDKLYEQLDDWKNFEAAKRFDAICRELQPEVWLM